MRILIIGDIVGRPGRCLLSMILPQIKEELSADFTIANGENAAGGFGITPKIARKIRSYGIDCITSGNHVWDRKEIIDFLPETDFLLRPANYPPMNPGRGSRIFSLNNERKIGVINLQGRTYMKNIDCPFRVGETIINEMRKETKIIIVDFHAETTAEKKAFAWFIDGKVSLVFGTHTHVQTADESIFPKGTGYITDIGMTGSFDSVIGVKKYSSINFFLKQTPERFDAAKKDRRMNGIFVEIDDVTGKTLKIERIERKVPDEDKNN
ncbi:MAG: TIGR00282 family metallophosphoesterase [Candidatus Cloacimonadota bacterium]|nr:MAG: TIGR00282 family metallophosphoesterase [Candidatus Cloacimonadota bacterium]